MDDPFDSYEQDLNTLSDSIRKQLTVELESKHGGAFQERRDESNADHRQSAEERNQLLRRVEMELEEADEIVRVL